jgi:hypothetical protein
LETTVLSITLSLITLVCILSGVVGGALLRRQLPEHHLSGDAKDVVRLGTGLIGTIAALVLGLLIASAKGSYDAQSSQIRQMTANIVLLDLLLEQYGDETRPIRDLIRRGMPPLVNGIWSGNELHSAPFKATTEGEAVFMKMQQLTPVNDIQRSLQARAIQVATAVAQARLLLFAQRDEGIPKPFLAVLVLWLTIIFGSFSLFAHPNRIVIGALAIFAFSATGAIYLILELSQPFAGLLQISSEPLRHALAPLAP